MTGYHISLGYNSGYSGSGDPWEKIREIVAFLRNFPALIVSEARAVEPFQWTDEEIREYLDAYSKAEDLTLREKTDEETGKPYLLLLASGGGESRKIKEALRRAFCRRIIWEAHKQGIEVSLIVA